MEIHTDSDEIDAAHDCIASSPLMFWGLMCSKASHNTAFTKSLHVLPFSCVHNVHVADTYEDLHSVSPAYESQDEFPIWYLHVHQLTSPPVDINGDVHQLEKQRTQGSWPCPCKPFLSKPLHACQHILQ
ncbi:TPA: hypothetical protein ACH3X1_011887 [Trebouxia sp. C0004]